MIKNWDTVEVGDQVIMKTGDDSIVQGSVVGFHMIDNDLHGEIMILWNISPTYRPQYNYPKNSAFISGVSFKSRMFFYTEPHEELVGKLKLSKDL